MAIKISTANPRYFEDNGKTILLAGSHTWYNLQPWTTRQNSVSEHIAVLKENNHNYVRGWVCTSLIVPWKADLSDPHRPLKMPYMRTGPGLAGDGEPKLDLTRFDESFFDDMHSRVKAYCDAGMYVSVMFDWSTMSYTDIKSVENNINNIVGTNDNVFVLENMPDNIKELHINFVRKVIKTLGDLQNVFWEVGNELHKGSMSYQSWIVDIVKNAEIAYGVVSRPIGITAPKVRDWGTISGDKAVNDALFASNADWISPVDSVEGSHDGGYSRNPPMNDGSKVVLLDTDHLRDENMPRNTSPQLYRQWAWKSFMRGINIMLMDDPWSEWDAPQIPNLQNGRNYVGDVRRYAERLDMARTIPSTTVSSTGYCLIGDAKYLIYQSNLGGGSFSVNVPEMEYDYEWFDPTARAVTDSGTMAVSPSTEFNTDRDMVLLLTKEIAVEITDDTKTFAIALTAPEIPAKGEIVNLTHPESVEQGASFDVNASTKNTGTVAGRFKMQLFIDNVLKATSPEFTLEGGATSADKIPPATAAVEGGSMAIAVKCIRLQE